VATKSVLVRIPPIGTDRQGARARVSALLTLGVDGIVFPHTQSPEEAAFGVSLLKAGTRGVWPLDRRANGVIGYFLIEDQDAVANVRDIARTPGIGMLSGGQGSLKQAFKGDAAQVEAALTSILDACKSAQIACATGVSETDVAHGVWPCTRSRKKTCWAMSPESSAEALSSTMLHVRGRPLVGSGCQAKPTRDAGVTAVSRE
jgi:2-keto-3-deoxy-L-rhamnonate aldolase RhmA